MTLIEIIYCSITILSLATIALCLWQEKSARISPTPVMPYIRRHALAMAQRHTRTDKAYRIADLGCGWGGLILALAKQYPLARTTGYEISICPYLTSKARTLFSKHSINVTRENFLKKDISDFDILFCYLSPYHMDALKQQLQTLKPGSIVVSCSFPIPGWDALETKIIRGLVSIPVFLYRTA